jgi:hypothetical protein
VVRSGTVGHKQLSVKTESGELVADALFGFRRRCLDGFPKRFERGSFVIAHRCEVMVGCLGFVCPGPCRSVPSVDLFWFHLIALS